MSQSAGSVPVVAVPVVPGATYVPVGGVPQNGCGGGMVILGIIIAIILILVFTWIIQLLWNYTITEIFGTRPITFWQALALWILIGLLFGGTWLGGAGSCAGAMRRGCH